MPADAVLLRLTVAAIVATTACSGGGDAEGTSRTGGMARVGQEAPEYRAFSLEGDSVSLADQRGKVVLLNVWATWCHPCRDEIPELRDIQTKYGERGFEVIGVSVDAGGSESGIASFARDFEVNYPIWLDPDERVSARFMVVGVPTTFLIGRSGTLLWRKTGPIQAGDTELFAAIERALDD